MLDLSIVLPAANDAARLARLVPELVRAMYRLGRSFELLTVDAGSTAAELAATRTLLREVPQARLLQLRTPGGIDAALTLGLSVIAGEAVVVLPADLRFAPDDIALLIERLARCDLVVGRRRQPRGTRYARTFAQFPRRVLGSVLVHDPASGFWAARRETVTGLDLFAGQFRYVPELIAGRGFRVGEVYVDYDATAARSRMNVPRPSLACLLATAWQVRHRPAAEGTDIELLNAPQIAVWRVSKDSSNHHRLDGRHLPITGASHEHL